MAHKLKPSATRIAIQETWSTISYYNFILEDKFITSLIHNIFLNYNLLTSKIIIKKLNNFYIITFFYYSNHSNIDIQSIYRIISFTKFILQSFLGKTIYFQIIELPSIIHNADILSNWINLELIKNPKLHKNILKRVLKEFKKWSIY